MKLNRPIEEAKEFIKANHKKFGGKKTLKEIGFELNVTGARVSQIAGTISVELSSGNPDALASEAA